MIEVFKTNVHCLKEAARLLDRIHGEFDGYCANFDLDDCDRILRVKSANGFVRAGCLISLLNECGFNAEVLAD
ncbi:hypothetical protein [Hufsiella ginkgonis]|uniref:Uncharacterized protein n=1 Tax=Hufsiella ginkgonis TaxID=2695274 RepID=A0A7K1XVS6_9SPHI|nr:hypothetical protein [Hufsiella ginkgonis]MXV15084.1 hypothetical protein [Hufsiella ginkgonis]